MTEQETLQSYLMRLHVAAHQPSLRAIATELGFSHTTVANMLHGLSRCPWVKVSALVHYLDGDLALAGRLWDAEAGTALRAGRAERRQTMSDLLIEIRDLLREVRDRLPDKEER